MKHPQDPFSERKMDRAVHSALADYFAKGDCKDLEDLEEEALTGFLKVFLDVCHREMHIPPEELDDEGLREVLLHWMPKRLPARRRGAEQAVRLIRDYYEYDRQDGKGARSLESGRAALFVEAEEKFPVMLREGNVEKGGAVEPLRAEAVKAGRNDPCPCGSGKKFKKCCAKAP